jgi:hypothetical protein
MWYQRTPFNEDQGNLMTEAVMTTVIEQLQKNVVWKWIGFSGSLRGQAENR